MPDPVELAHLVRERRPLVEPETLEAPQALHRDEAVLVGGVPHLGTRGSRSFSQVYTASRFEALTTRRNCPCASR